MLQIIGLMGCAYLFVKAFEMMGNSGLRKEDGGMADHATVAVFIAFGSAVVFGLWLIAQGLSIEQSSFASGATAPASLSSVEIDCINSAKTNDEVLAC